MKYFKTADPDDMSQGELSKRVHFIKKEEGGQALMCEIVDGWLEEARREAKILGRAEGRAEGHRSGIIDGKKETAINLYSMGMAIEKISLAVKESAAIVEEWLSLAKAGNTGTRR